MKAVVSALGLGLLTGCTADGLGPGPAVDRDPDNPVYGRLLYEDRCLSCHGPTGRGDGPAAAALPLPPANLRMLAAANDGVFDRDLVMSTIFEPPGSEASRMPAFGHSDLGPWILVEEDEEGRATPIPRDLLAIATYLETIQDM